MRPLQVLGVVSLATFMAALDGSVVNVALPVIRSEFSADVSAMEWVPMAYLLSICALLLPFGRLGDMLGYHRLMGIGFAAFGLASAACGWAGGLWTLVAARAVQGIGAALLMASGPALLSTSFPPESRGRVLGLQATATYAGLAIGPTVGGLVTHHLGWRWVFWINLPAALLGALALLRSPREKAAARHPMDYAGAALFAGALVSAILAVERFGRGAGAGAAGLGAAAAVLGTSFVLRQGRAKVPLLPLAMFRSAAFSAGVVAAFLQYVVIFVPTFLVPFFLQGPLGLAPDRAGLVMSTQPLVMVAITGMAGWASDRVGTRAPAAAGMAVLVVGLWLLSTATPASGSGWVAISLAIIGLGVGLFTSPNNSAILGSAARERQGVASALLAAARNVGMVFGVSLAAAVLSQVRARSQAPEEALLPAFRLAMRIAAALAAAAVVLALLRPTVNKPAPKPG